MASADYWACYLGHRMPNGDKDDPRNYYPVCIQCKKWQEDENAEAAPDEPYPAYLRTRPGEETGYGFVPWTWTCKAKIGEETCNFRVLWDSTNCHNSKCAPPDGAPRPAKPKLVWGHPATLEPYEGPTDEEIEEIEEVRGKKSKKGHRWIPGCPAVCKSPHDFEFGLRVHGPRRARLDETIEVTAVILPQIDPAKPIGKLYWEIVEGQEIATFPKSKGTKLETHGADNRVTVRASEPGKVVVQCVFKLGKNALGQVETYPVKVKKNDEREVLPPPKVSLEFYESVEADVEILQFYLAGSEAKSNSYRIVDGKEEKEALGTDAFFFAPSTDDAITLNFSLNDPSDARAKLRLEAYTADGATLVGHWDLPEEASRGGQRQHTWDGSLTSEGDLLPEGYLTLEHSPYKLRLVYVDVKDQPDAWTFCEVQPAYVDLLFGKRDLLGDDSKSRAVVAGLEKEPVPKAGEVQPIVLPLKTMCTVTEKEEMHDDGVFRGGLMLTRPDAAHKNDWEDGPEVPVLARVHIKRHNGSGTFASKAVGRVPVYWRAELPTEKDAGVLKAQSANEGDEFVSMARSMLGWGPDGADAFGETYATWNAGEDVGGKRSRYFEAQAGDGTFPFEVSPINGGVEAFAWTAGGGDYAGRAGVLFRPSRLAGDAYSLIVALCPPDTQGTQDEADGLLLNSPSFVRTGLLQTWRSLYVASYWRGTNKVQVNWPQVRKNYAPVHMKVRGPGKIDRFKGINYNWMVEETEKLYYKASPRPKDKLPEFVPLSMGQLEEQDDVATQVLVRPREAFNSEMEQGFKDAGALHEPSLYSTDGGYAAKVEANQRYYHDAYGPWLEEMGGGINVMHFEAVDNLDAIDLWGKAPKTSDCYATSSRKALLFLYGNNPGTATHEIGHHIGLNHGHGGPREPNDAEAAEHSNETCTMSYADERKGFCGLCHLLMGGWNLQALVKFKIDYGFD